MEFYIVNEFDAPKPHIVAFEKGGLLYYLDKELRAKYPGMPMDRATNLKRFGFGVTQKGNVLQFEKVQQSVATYKDGKPREWQGAWHFTYEYPV